MTAFSVFCLDLIPLMRFNDLVPVQIETCHETNLPQKEALLEFLRGQLLCFALGSIGPGTVREVE
jgi:hypothetical protein